MCVRQIITGGHGCGLLSTSLPCETAYRWGRIPPSFCWSPYTIFTTRRIFVWPDKVKITFPNWRTFTWPDKTRCTWLLSIAKTASQFYSSVLSGFSSCCPSSHVVLVVLVVVDVVDSLGCENCDTVLAMLCLTPGSSAQPRLSHRFLFGPQRIRVSWQSLFHSPCFHPVSS